MPEHLLRASSVEASEPEEQQATRSIPHCQWHQGGKKEYVDIGEDETNVTWKKYDDSKKKICKQLIEKIIFQTKDDSFDVVHRFVQIPHRNYKLGRQQQQETDQQRQQQQDLPSGCMRKYDSFQCYDE